MFSISYANIEIHKKYAKIHLKRFFFTVKHIHIFVVN